MRVTVCQLPDPPQGFEESWRALCAHTRESGPELVLLPELPFHTWPAWTPQYRPAIWESGVDSHLQWIERLDELCAAVIGGSRPITTPSGKRHNRAFVWTGGVLSDGHDKVYLPDEPGFWEASWYQPGDGSFDAMKLSSCTVGFMTCTDLWFTEHARSYARQGAHLLLVPRATEMRSREKWLAGGRVASVMSGAFCLSSNRSGSSHQVVYGGAGWVIDPDGVVVGLTSEEEPFLTVDIDLAVAEAAKSTYPRYVKE